VVVVVVFVQLEHLEAVELVVGETAHSTLLVELLAK
jgi:hypothetical protein